jgi:hypothetical protein
MNPHEVPAYKPPIRQGAIPPKPQPSQGRLPQSVIITGVNIPFLSLAWLLAKIALASIPAAFIFAGVILLIVMALGGVGGIINIIAGG